MLGSDKIWLIVKTPEKRWKGLTANHHGQWRYRIGDYRLICEIDDQKLVILALSIGHRRNVYKR